MSVLIKGMEMYERCNDPDGHWACPLFGSVYPHGVFCKENKREIEDPFSRQPWCPLVPVPKHGRLIDADACVDYIRENDQHAWEALAYAPTIIEAEEET